MTQLLGLSFDSAASPSLHLKALERPRADLDQPYGWGLAWYPNGDVAALVVKDPSSVNSNALTKVLSEWESFSSTIFVAHLRGAAKRVSQMDTHPFSRSFAGRDWVMAHNGNLTGDWRAALPLTESDPFEPVGHTDSEHAFCWLLSRIRALGARRLADPGYARVHAWLSAINQLGDANILLSDGQDLVVHNDHAAFNNLHMARILPAKKGVSFSSEDFDLDLGDPNEYSRTAVVVATQPLGPRGWTALEPGQTLVLRRGAVLWDSTGQHATASDNGVVSGPGSGRRARTTQTRPLAPTRPAPTPVAVTPMRTTSSQSPDAAAFVMPSGASIDAPLVEHREAPNTGLVFVEREAARLKGRVLHVEHETIYRYDRAVELSTHIFRLRPAHDELQELLEFSLEVNPPCALRHYDDVFGNSSTRAEVHEHYRTLRIVARSTVRLLAPEEPRLLAHDRRVTIPLVWMPWQRQMMTPYLLPPELPESQLQALSEYAMSFVERQDYDLVETLRDINRTIFADYAYITSSTELATTPFDVYVERRGVCQDFANLFICLARLLGIPARYRTGYIFTGGRYENTRQGDASHAWAELYLPWQGWTGFDPTNGCLVGRDHVRVACGRNFRDATPTSGTIYKGGGPERLEVNVRVTENLAHLSVR